MGFNYWYSDSVLGTDWIGVNIADQRDTVSKCVWITKCLVTVPRFSNAAQLRGVRILLLDCFKALLKESFVWQEVALWDVSTLSVFLARAIECHWSSIVTCFQFYSIETFVFIIIIEVFTVFQRSALFLISLIIINITSWFFEGFIVTLLSHLSTFSPFHRPSIELQNLVEENDSRANQSKASKLCPRKSLMTKPRLQQEESPNSHGSCLLHDRSCSGRGIFCYCYPKSIKEQRCQYEHNSIKN